MGAEPYWYFVKHEEDANAALQKLRQREFAAGRYNPVMADLSFPVGPGSPAPGAQHASMDEALEASGEDGTRSILDLVRVGEEADFMVARLLPPDELEDLLGTTQPTRAHLETLEVLEQVERGQGVCIVVYRDGKKDELFFGGYSFD